MKQTKLMLILTTLLFACCGLGLRVYQLKHCMTEEGLIQEGSPILYIMLAFALLFVVLAALLCAGFDKSLGDGRCLCASAANLFADLMGASVIFYGALLRMMGGESMPVFVGVMAAAVCLAIAALLYDRRSKLIFWLLILPALGFGVLLVFDFKHWSVDPKVIDFLFRQLALVGGMLAVLHVSAFPIIYGRRRITVFWCALSVMFSVMTLPDFFLNRTISLGELLIPLGLAVWCASHGIRLMRTETRSERPSEAYAPRMMEPSSVAERPRRSGKGRFEHP